MRHLSTNRPFICVTCEVEIDGSPVFHVGLAFCCAGCIAGGPCICSYDKEDIAQTLPVPAGRRTVTVLSIA